MKNNILIIFIFFSACVPKTKMQIDGSRLESLNKMRIPNSSYVLYDYSYAETMAWSSLVTGHTVLLWIQRKYFH